MHLERAKAFGRRLARSVIAALPLPEPAKFAVVSRGRSGSNLLLSLLSSHARVRVCSEVIGESRLRQPCLKKQIRDLGPVAYVRRCFGRTGFESTVGIKILYYQVEEDYGQRWGVDGLPDVLDFLKSQRDIRIIHLKRRNRLKCLTSIRLAGLTKKYRETTDHAEKVDTVSITLSTDECEQEFRRVGEWEALYDRVFQDHQMLEVYYERLAAERQTECDRTLDFLGVSGRPLTTSMKKQRKSPLREVIDNYDELEEHFAGTEWARFFEEQDRGR